MPGAFTVSKTLILSSVIWAEVGESQLIGPKIVQETTEKIIQIKERLKTARSRQKSYADKRCKPLEFKVGDQELSCIHDTFHVSNLKKCLAEFDVQVPLEEIEIDENLCFVEEPIEIVDRDVKKLKRRKILLFKVRWNSRQGAEYTWEREDQFKTKSKEGVVWFKAEGFEKVEQVFEICKCAEEDKVMFAASTFECCALTWWNGNVHTLGLVNANRILWIEFKSMMTTEYCLATEIQRMEEELWTLTLKGDDIEAYNIFP
ncbi:putative reverse transcriptase domain-containing protein [Tanacetum coccineum]